jgi:hypothetical protein
LEERLLHAGVLGLPAALLVRCQHVQQLLVLGLARLLVNDSAVFLESRIHHAAVLDQAAALGQDERAGFDYMAEIIPFG